MSKKLPEAFSVESALEALNDLYLGLAKTKQPSYLGHFNEIGVVIEKLAKKARVDRNKDLT